MSVTVESSDNVNRSTCAEQQNMAIRQLTVSVYCGHRKNNNEGTCGQDEKHTTANVTAKRRHRSSDNDGHSLTPPF